MLPWTAPPSVSAPPAVVSQVSSVKVKPVFASPKDMTPAPLELMRPATLIALGALAVKPPAKLKVSVAASPSVKLPVFKKVVALVMAVFAPNNAKLYPRPVVVNVGVTKLFANVRVLAVSLSTTLESVFTAAAKVAELL